MTSNLPPFLRGYLGFLLMLCLVVVGLAAVTILDPNAGQRRERVDTLASGPYFVEKVVNSSPAYLAFVNTERHKISPHIVETWIAEHDALGLRGLQCVPRSLRDERPLFLGERGIKMQHERIGVGA